MQLIISPHVELLIAMLKVSLCRGFMDRLRHFNGQVCFFEEASFTELFKITSKTPAGIAAPIVMHIASLQANLALRYLAGLSVKKINSITCFLMKRESW